MNVCVICYGRTGGTSFGNWLSKELNMEYIHEPFNTNHNHLYIYKNIDYNKNKFVIKLQPEQLELIPNSKKKIGLIRENVIDCAISFLHAMENDKWHRGYSITEHWIESRIEKLNLLKEGIEKQNNIIKNMDLDILVTYEGVYENQTDIDRLQKFFMVNEFNYTSQYLNPKIRYRNKKNVII